MGIKAVESIGALPTRSLGLRCDCAGRSKGQVLRGMACLPHEGISWHDRNSAQSRHMLFHWDAMSVAKTWAEAFRLLS